MTTGSLVWRMPRAARIPTLHSERSRTFRCFCLGTMMSVQMYELIGDGLLTLSLP
jgi:hypothetical protein